MADETSKTKKAYKINKTIKPPKQEAIAKMEKIDKVEYSVMLWSRMR